jgi:hypothetical protein
VGGLSEAAGWEAGEGRECVEVMDSTLQLE